MSLKSNDELYDYIGSKREVFLGRYKKTEKDVIKEDGEEYILVRNSLGKEIKVALPDDLNIQNYD